jgi:hypothetical protein
VSENLLDNPLPIELDPRLSALISGQQFLGDSSASPAQRKEMSRR